MSTTPIFRPAPCLMFVACDAGVSEACAAILPGLPQLRVTHAAAAVERMLVTRPLVIVVEESLAGSHLARVVECARDIRAEVVVLPAFPGPDAVAQVASAVQTAERNRGDGDAALPKA
jgi:hypothetical protein